MRNTGCNRQRPSVRRRPLRWRTQLLPQEPRYPVLTPALLTDADQTGEPGKAGFSTAGATGLGAPMSSC